MNLKSSIVILNLKTPERTNTDIPFHAYISQDEMSYKTTHIERYQYFLVCLHKQYQNTIIEWGNLTSRTVLFAACKKQINKNPV